MVLTRLFFLRLPLFSTMSPFPFFAQTQISCLQFAFFHVAVHFFCFNSGILALPLCVGIFFFLDLVVSNYCVARHYATKGNNDVELEMLLHKVHPLQLCMDMGRRASTWWLYLLHFFLSMRCFSFGFRSFLVKPGKYYNVESRKILTVFMWNLCNCITSESVWSQSVDEAKIN